MRRVLACLAILSLASPAAADLIGDTNLPPAENVVLKWNSIWLDCVRATGGAPGPIGRAGAMVHVAVYDAVVSISGDYTPYLHGIPKLKRASIVAAAAQAAHDVLVTLYPTQVSTLDAELLASLGEVPPGLERRQGIQVGRLAAAAAIRSRKNDGSDDTTPYVPETGPGDWRPTLPDFSPAVTPNWGHVKPWAMERGDQFQPAGPFGTEDVRALLGSEAYARVYDDVKAYGAKNSTSRSADQTQIAFFWANDVNGTYKPPGHLNHIAQVLAQQTGLSTVRTARLFAMLNIALADAGIVAWDAKYDMGLDFWRPVTGIREADTDGNPLTVADPSWEPLNAFTPAFPAYISGHATFGATAAAVFASFFGTDRMTYTISTDEPLYQGAPRTYQTFSEAALENGRSRIYLGVHWQFDADDGYAAGTALGQYVARSVLQPLTGDERDLIAADLDLPTAGGALPADELEPEVIDATLSLRAAPVESGTTMIALDQPVQGHVRVSVLDLQGRRLAELFDGAHAAGAWTVAWEGRSFDGARVTPGVYFVLAEAAGYRASQKIIVMR